MLPGRGTLIPVEVFKTIGNFNQKKLPHYGADYEFSFRAKQAGYRLLIANRARVYAKLCVTGIDQLDKRIISHKECYELLFSPKSKINLFHCLNYVWLCSEKGYRYKNIFNRAKGILLGTICKTPFIYPFRFIMIMFSYAMKGAVKGTNFLVFCYPVRSDDIKRCGLSPRELVKYRLMSEVPYRGESFYRIDKKMEPALLKLSEKDRGRFLELKRVSGSYIHKLSIVFEKISLLLDGNKK